MANDSNRAHRVMTSKSRNYLQVVRILLYYSILLWTHPRKSLTIFINPNPCSWYWIPGNHPRRLGIKLVTWSPYNLNPLGTGQRVRYFEVVSIDTSTQHTYIPLSNRHVSCVLLVSSNLVVTFLSQPTYISYIFIKYIKKLIIFKWSAVVLWCSK